MRPGYLLKCIYHDKKNSRLIFQGKMSQFGRTYLFRTHNSSHAVWKSSTGKRGMMHRNNMLGVRLKKNTVSASSSNSLLEWQTWGTLFMVKSSLPACEANMHWAETGFQTGKQMGQHIELSSIEELSVAHGSNLNLFWKVKRGGVNLFLFSPKLVPSSSVCRKGRNQSIKLREAS
jgi:hypothetical protein